jgi:hypothetical protein
MARKSIAMRNGFRNGTRGEFFESLAALFLEPVKKQ